MSVVLEDTSLIVTWVGSNLSIFFKNFDLGPMPVLIKHRYINIIKVMMSFDVPS
jgi:hypothetical protein